MANNKSFLLFFLVVVLFCVVTGARSADQTEDQGLLVQLQQQISLIARQITDILNGQKAAVSGTTNCVHFVDSSNRGAISYVFLGTTKTATDYCLSDSKLMEYYCNLGSAFGRTKICENGCQNGVCKSAVSCSANWTCTEWSVCSNGQKARTCNDSKNCGIMTGKPAESQNCSVANTGGCVDSDVGVGFPNSLTIKGTCTDKMGTYTDYSSTSDNGVHEFSCYQDACIDTNFNCSWQFPTQYPYSVGGACQYSKPSVCVPNWVCGDWSICSNGQQARTCNDSKNCGIMTGKPAISQACVLSQPRITQVWSPYNGAQWQIGKNYSIQWYTENMSSADSEKVIIQLLDYTNNIAGIPVETIAKTTITHSGNLSQDLLTMSWTIPSLTKTGDPITGNKFKILVKGLTGGEAKSDGYFSIISDKFICVDSDSDSANPVFVKGTCVDANGAYADYSPGPGNTKLVEYSCAYNVCITNNYSCLYSADGFCQEPPITCSPKWNCTGWSGCSSGQQTRTCSDANSCGVTTDKPATSKACSCAPSWSCDLWSACSNGQQTRKCNDLKNCGVATGKPAETKSCWAFCSDSDNGKEYFTKGTVTYNNAITEKDLYAYDYCNGPTKLVEYYCDGDKARGEVKVCEGGCSDSKCKSPYSCVPSWTCGSWTNCSNSQQTRICSDSHNCGSNIGKPATVQSCSMSCSPKWECTEWSICSNKQQHRNCNDVNKCGVLTNMPNEWQGCVEANTCTDSDLSSGYPGYYFVKGTCIDKNATYTDSSFDSVKINEYFCFNNLCYLTSPYCSAVLPGKPYSYDGACHSSPKN